MGLSSILNTATSGLRATQAGLDVVSTNVSNAGAVGYTRRTVTLSQQVAAGQTTGVDVSAPQRALDTIVQRQLRLEQAGAAYTAVKASYHGSLDKMFDAPGGAGSLPTLVNGFTSALGTLANDPTTYGSRLAVLSTATSLASSLNGLSGQVQSLRQNAEDKLAENVSRADTILQQIEKANAQVVAATMTGGSAGLEDQRDALIGQLSQLMDVSVTSKGNGSVAVATTGGYTLFNGATATRLSFDAHRPVAAQSAYSTDRAARTLGTISGADASGRSTDLIASGAIRSGEIKGLVELRDETLVEAQRQLDELAAGLASSLSDAKVSGTAATAGTQTGFDLDLSGLAAGNPIGVSVTVGGTAKTVTFVKASSATAAAAATASGDGVVGIDFSGGMGAVATQIAAALNGTGTGFTVSNPSGSTLRILDDGGTGNTDVTAASATRTVTTLLGGDPQLALFVDGDAGQAYTGSYEKGAQLAGFASRIVVNPGVKANIATLATTSPTAPIGDATRPAFLLERLTSVDRVFSGATGIGGSNAASTSSVVGFATQIVATQAAAANSATQLDTGQQTVLRALESRFSEQAGVNMDTELTQLIQLQTAYGANARILTAARDMMDMLLRVGA